DVPPSPAPPHMGSDGRYYYRTSSSSRPMEHYQVADAFGKRRRPILRPTMTFSQFNPQERSLRVKFGVTNEGQALAKWVMVHAKFVGCQLEKEKNAAWWQRVWSQKGEDDMEEWFVTYESPISTLHQGMMTSYQPIEVRMASPLAVVTVLVGAEEAPTESYVAMVSERWIRSS